VFVSNPEFILETQNHSALAYRQIQREAGALWYNYVSFRRIEGGLTPLQNPAQVTLSLDAVSRRFGRRMVFSGVSAQAQTGEALVITGANGSGKSTLLKIIAGLLSPSAGSVKFSVGTAQLDAVQRRQYLGYVSPDLTLYSELSGAENLQFFGGLRGLTLTRDDLIAALERVGLKGRGRDYVGNYSSGMRHRLKIAFALLGSPPILILDEPTANLDADGAAIVEAIITEQKKRGLVLIGTNEAREVGWGDVVVRLGEPT
jgi:heme exporter protein A